MGIDRSAVYRLTRQGLHNPALASKSCYPSRILVASLERLQHVNLGLPLYPQSMEASPDVLRRELSSLGLESRTRALRCLTSHLSFQARGWYK